MGSGLVLIGIGLLTMTTVDAASSWTVLINNVDSIFVGGKARKRNGKLLDVDFPAFRKKVDQHRDALFARAGVPIDGSWIVTPYSEEPKVEF